MKRKRLKQLSVFSMILMLSALNHATIPLIESERVKIHRVE